MRQTLVTAVLAALASTACFDVQEVDLKGKASSRVMLDDFEDSDLVPTSNLFDAWNCYQFSPEPAVPDCGFVGGADSNLAYSLRFDLKGPTAPSDDGIGAGLSLSRTAGTLDLSTYQNLHVNAKVDSGSPLLPAAALFEIGIVCTTVNHGNGTGTWLPIVVEDYLILNEFKSADDWRSFTIELHQLMPPDWLKTQEPSAADCLRVVDIVQFQVSSSFAVNQTATGSMTIDDVWLE